MDSSDNFPSPGSFGKNLISLSSVDDLNAPLSIRITLDGIMIVSSFVPAKTSTNIAFTVSGMVNIPVFAAGTYTNSLTLLVPFLYISNPESDVLYSGSITPST